MRWRELNFAAAVAISAAGHLMLYPAAKHIAAGGGKGDRGADSPEITFELASDTKPGVVLPPVARPMQLTTSSPSPSVPKPPPVQPPPPGAKPQKPKPPVPVPENNEEFGDRKGKGEAFNSAKGIELMRAPAADQDQAQLDTEPRGRGKIGDRPAKNTDPRGEGGTGGQVGRPEIAARHASAPSPTSPQAPARQPAAISAQKPAGAPFAQASAQAEPSPIRSLLPDEALPSDHSPPPKTLDPFSLNDAAARAPAPRDEKPPFPRDEYPQASRDEKLASPRNPRPAAPRDEKTAAPRQTSKTFDTADPSPAPRPLVIQPVLENSAASTPIGTAQAAMTDPAAHVPPGSAAANGRASSRSVKGPENAPPTDIAPRESPVRTAQAPSPQPPMPTTATPPPADRALAGAAKVDLSKQPAAAIKPTGGLVKVESDDPLAGNVAPTLGPIVKPRPGSSKAPPTVGARADSPAVAAARPAPLPTAAVVAPPPPAVDPPAPGVMGSAQTPPVHASPIADAVARPSRGNPQYAIRTADEPSVIPPTEPVAVAADRKPAWPEQTTPRPPSVASSPAAVPAQSATDNPDAARPSQHQAVQTAIRPPSTASPAQSPQHAIAHTGDGLAPGNDRPAADPAQQSDSESDAFSKKLISVVVRDGRLDVRNGRKIRTTRPNIFTAGAQAALFANPNAAVVLKISIDATGTPTNVDFIERSGDDAIDQPCRLAAYSWWIEPAHDQNGRAIADVIPFAIIFR